MYAAVEKAFGCAAAIQRCQWYKRDNVLAYLAGAPQAVIRRTLQAAYSQPTYEHAKTALKKVRGELAEISLSAVASLDEGFEETLTLHRLGLFAEFGVSFKTTNCLESINANQPLGERGHLLALRATTDGIEAVDRHDQVVTLAVPDSLRRTKLTHDHPPVSVPG